MELENAVVGKIKDSSRPEVQIAKLIHCDATFRKFLKATKPKDRKTAYAKIKPLLDFKAKPLSVLLKGHLPEPEGRLMLTCQTCSTKELIVAETPVDGAIKARNAGWKLIAGMMFCPKCSDKSESIPGSDAKAS